MPKSLFYLLTYCFFFAINGNIGMDLNRLPIENTVVLAIICQLKWFFNYDSIGGITSQQFTDGFDRFRMHLNG